MSNPTASAHLAATAHEPEGTHTPKRAAASGWIGSALEY